MSIKLNPEQIKNWRNVIAHQFGIVAFIMPDSDVERYANWVQVQINSFAQDEREKICSCDPKKHGTTTKRSGDVVCNNCHKERNTP